MKTSVCIKLKSYNETNVIATFGKNFHDCFRMLRMLELDQLMSYGGFPVNYTYYIEYKEKGEIKTLRSELREVKQYAIELSGRLNVNADFIQNNFSYQGI
jgi:hypothetical protein